MYHTFAGHRGMQDSTAESVNYMSARDNHVVGVMSHCESNESRKLTRSPCKVAVYVYKPTTHYTVPTLDRYSVLVLRGS